MIFGYSKENAPFVLTQLIKSLKIPVSSFTLKKDLYDHPDYPSLLALSDCLTNWRVANEAFKIDKETCQIEELPLPFVAHVNLDGGSFILVNGFKKDRVSFTDENEAKGVLERSEFLKRWDGVILYAEKGQDSGEDNYYQSRIHGFLERARLPFLVSALLLALITSVDLGHTDILQIGLIIAKIAGIAVGALLLMYSMDAGNSFIQNICSLGKRNNCNAILKSDAAKVTNWLTWSEVGMFYFFGSLICLIAVPASLPLLALLNVLCLPYTFYSIGYQIKIKNWCVLCCSVQALLWIEAFIFMSIGYRTLLATLNFSMQQFTSVALCFITPVAIWSFIKPFLKDSGEAKPLKQQLKRFKYDASLFGHVLSTQPRFDVSNDLTPMVFGNPNADTVITMVSNPYCGPCATAHKKLDILLAGRDDIKLNIIYMTPGQKDEKRTNVVRHMLAFALVNNQEKTEHALNEWYGQTVKDFDTWEARFPVNIDDRVNECTERQNEWCETAEIMGTPSIFINGYKLTAPYMLDDLRYLL